MFHLKYPRFRGFFAWDELGCLSRALGFPTDMFRSHLTEDIMAEENGLPYKEVTRMMDFKHLYKALHLTVNLHTADWNTCVIRRSLDILDNRGLTYEEIYNARVAYQAYEASDMKGMQINQHVLMRTLKMCSMTISPMKLMHRVKHSRCEYDEPGRIQLYEFLDLILWAHGYEEFTPDKTYGHFEMEDNLFKLTDFDHLLSHHDQRLATKLDTQYLQDEWEFKREKRANKSKFRDPAVICGDSRVEAATNQKNTYKFLRSEIGRSQKTLNGTKSGCVRERPLTAPDLHMYNVRQQMEYKRRQSQAAQHALYDKLQRLIKHTEPRDGGTDIAAVDMSDRPARELPQHLNNKPVVSEDDVEETEKRLQRLLFDIETEEGRYEIEKEMEMDHYIPGYKERQEDKRKSATFPFQHKKVKTQKQQRTATQYEDVLRSLAYPTPHIPPSHAKKCDARFRGWYGARSRKGPHYILMSPYFSNTPKGQLLKKLAKMSESEIKQIHGNFIYRHTQSSDIDQRPVTAPAVLSETRNQVPKGNNSRASRVSSGYGSMEDGEGRDIDAELDLKPEDGQTTNDEPETAKVEVTREVKDITNDLEEIEDKAKSKPNFGSEKNIQDFDSSESCVTTLTEKLDNLARERADNVKSPEQVRRSKSAYLSPGDKTVLPDPYSRSQSVIGTSTTTPNDSSAVDIAPTPYMDHSRAKVVSVGSIGKISILESISEAKYWEDLVQKEAEERRRREHDVLVIRHGEDWKEAEEVESGYGDGDKRDEAPAVSSQQEIKGTEGEIYEKEEVKRHGKSGDEVDEECGNIIEMLLEAEKKKRRKSFATGYRPGQFSSGVRAPRTSVSGPSGKNSSKPRKSTSSIPEKVPDRVSHACKSNKSKVKLTSHSDKQRKMITLEFQDNATSSPGHVDTAHDTESRRLKRANKYDRLLHRMGEDISNQFAKRLMAI